MFSTNIKNNIAYGDPIAEQSEIEIVAKIAKIHEEILNFPKQYETLVGERGITLSGGQRQRTALARALLVDAPILILDDALSSVDNQTATEIFTEFKSQDSKKNRCFYLPSNVCGGYGRSDFGDGKRQHYSNRNP